MLSPKGVYGTFTILSVYISFYAVFFCLYIVTYFHGKKGASKFVMPLDRATLWSDKGNRMQEMDQHNIYYPELDGYEVANITVGKYCGQF